jgi:hypothetical protein
VSPALVRHFLRQERHVCHQPAMLLRSQKNRRLQTRPLQPRPSWCSVRRRDPLQPGNTPASTSRHRALLRTQNCPPRSNCPAPKGSIDLRVLRYSSPSYGVPRMNHNTLYRFPPGMDKLRVTRGRGALALMALPGGSVAGYSSGAFSTPNLRRARPIEGFASEPG